MPKKRVKKSACKRKKTKKVPTKANSKTGINLRDIILGGQDGLVNILGLALGVAAATNDARIIIVSGLAGTFAESISMAAVAYTSSKAARDYYYGMLEKEKAQIKDAPCMGEQAIEGIYKNKGFSGQLLKKIVKKITSNKRIWLTTMMAEELRLFPDEYQNPGRDAWIVGLASIVGSLIPLAPFFFIGVTQAVWWSLIVTALTLFITGAYKATITIGDWRRAGLEMAIIGIAAAVMGFLIGHFVGALPIG